MREPHDAPFERIPWSTPAVLETTLRRCSDAGLRVELLDRWGDIDTDIAYAALTHAVGKNSPGEWRIFGLGYHDGRRVTKADNRPAAAIAADQHNIRIATLGGNYLQTAKTGSGTACRARKTKSGLLSMASVPSTAVRREISRFVITNISTAPTAVIAA